MVLFYNCRVDRQGKSPGYALLNGGGAQVRPKEMASYADGGGRLLTFNFDNMPGCKTTYNTIAIWAEGSRTGSTINYKHAFEYVMWEGAD